MTGCFSIEPTNFPLLPLTLAPRMWGFVQIGTQVLTNQYTGANYAPYKHSTRYTDRPYCGGHSRNTQSKKLTLLLAYYYLGVRVIQQVIVPKLSFSIVLHQEGEDGMNNVLSTSSVLCPTSLFSFRIPRHSLSAVLRL